MSATGLLRLPCFLHQVIQALKHQQQFRLEQSQSFPSLIKTTDDLPATLILAGILLFLRIFMDRTFFNLFFSHFPLNFRRKISESLFSCTYYLFASLYFCFHLWPQVDWSVNLLSNEMIVRNLFYPNPPPMIKEEHVFYAMSAGYYVYVSIFVVVLDSKRPDFNQVALHHVVTLFLLFTSYAYGYVRCGILIIALHNAGDFLLYFAKFLHYLGYRGIDTAVFGLFAIVFYITRLILYSRITYSSVVETIQIMHKEPSFNGWSMYYEVYLVHHLVFFVLLGSLQVLQCFWFSLIVKMMIRESFPGKKISKKGLI